MENSEQDVIWFLTGSQHLYGEETLRQVHAHARTIAAALAGSAEIPARVTDHEPLTDADAIRRVLTEASADERCVGVILWMHTFSPAKMWIAGLAALRKPLLHLHTQFDRDLPWGEIDMDYMNLNQSAHGDREFGFIESRMGIVRKTVVGHWQDTDVQRRIGTWLRAARGYAEARRLRVARFGDNMRDVAVTEGDKVGAQMDLGATVNGYGIDGLGVAVAEADAGAVRELVLAYEDSYALAPELRDGGDRRESLIEAARIEAGLRAFLQRGGFRAFTDTFEDLGALRQLPGIAVQRLMADGYGFGAEGDWKTAVLLRVMKVMAAGLPGGTSFMEDYVYHLGPGGAKILGAHMLEVCPTIAADRPSCEIHPLAIGGREDPVRLVFTAPPGPGLVVCLIQIGGRLRLVANEVEVVAPDADLPRLPVARAVWRPQPDLSTAAEAWLAAGGSHHSVFTMALSTEAVRDLAHMWGIELVVIDERTSIHQFINELRWNQAYYHLARGL
ncbi:MAG TPA: L-arabinose isomerase [Solirubrobacteraceae bacterium]|nr:L-arabinose isomerase [Solirubrobacteraceae bacterium]